MKFIAVVFFLTMLSVGCSKTGTQTAIQSQSVSPSTQATETQTSKTDFAAPLASNREQLLISNADKNEEWFLYQSTDPEKIASYHSTDSGKTWLQAGLPTKLPWEQGHFNSNNVFASFHYQHENLPSWILLTSEPALGQMGKTLYQTTDNGKTWRQIADVSTVVDGYVTGIVFRNSLNGWITATQHGVEMLPLYHSNDGGRTWTVQKIDIPTGYKYGNTFPPVFNKSNTNKGSMNIEFVGDSQRSTLEYVTTDGGQSWEPQLLNNRQEFYK